MIFLHIKPISQAPVYIFNNAIETCCPPGPPLPSCTAGCDYLPGPETGCHGDHSPCSFPDPNTVVGGKALGFYPTLLFYTLHFVFILMHLVVHLDCLISAQRKWHP